MTDQGKFAISVRHIASNKEQTFLVDITQGDPMEKIGRLVTAMLSLVGEIQPKETIDADPTE